MQKNKLKLIIGLLVCTLFLLSGCQEKKAESKVIKASLDNLHPIIYDENDVKISLGRCEYTKGESDLRITLSINNESDQTILVSLKDIKILDKQFYEMDDESSVIESGGLYDSSYYVSGKDLVKSEATEFKKANCTFSIEDESENEIMEQEIVIDFDVFEPYDPEDITYEEDTSDAYSTVVYDAYEEAKAIDDSNIVKSEYNTTYNGIQIISEEEQWLEDGAVYRSLAKKIEGFYMGANNNNTISFICGIDESLSRDEMTPYVDTASRVVTRENTLQSVMSAFQEANSIEGNFDFDNNIYDFEITNLESASDELGITPKMLGYTLAMLDEYAPTVEFGDNTYQCTWFRKK